MNMEDACSGITLVIETELGVNDDDEAKVDKTCVESIIVSCDVRIILVLMNTLLVGFGMEVVLFTFGVCMGMTSERCWVTDAGSTEELDEDGDGAIVTTVGGGRLDVTTVSTTSPQISRITGKETEIFKNLM